MVVDLAAVATIIDKRNLAEWSDRSGEPGPQMDFEGICDAAVSGQGPDQVAVVKYDCASAFERQHRAHMTHGGAAALLRERLWIVLTHAPDVGEAAAFWHQMA